MVERGGLHRLLNLPMVYTAFQRLISRSGATGIDQPVLYPELGTRKIRVLDIGCGPAAFWARHQRLGGITYVGIEPNATYVEDARARFPDIELHAGTVPEVRNNVMDRFDLIVLEGVLHHVDDATACEALEFASQHLAPGGRLVALDPVLLDRQHPVARALARLDRGKYVRTLDGYRSLALTAFPATSVTVRPLSGQLRVPYDHSLLEVAGS